MPSDSPHKSSGAKFEKQQTPNSQLSDVEHDEERPKRSSQRQSARRAAEKITKDRSSRSHSPVADPKSAARQGHSADEERTSYKAPARPSRLYSAMISQPSRLLPRRKELLIVLDLNGTLLFRPGSRRDRSTHPVHRPYVRALFEYARRRKHALCVWSSTRQENVYTMLASLLRIEPAVDAQEISEKLNETFDYIWCRDTLGLSLTDMSPSSLYLFHSHPDACLQDKKVLTTKDLSVLWSALEESHGAEPAVRATAKYPPPNPKEYHPASSKPWNATNTILIDDSTYKARLQPFNHLLIPEFTPSDAELPRYRQMQASCQGSTVATDDYPKEIPEDGKKDLDCTLLAVIGMLETLSLQSNVASYMSSHAYTPEGSEEKPSLPAEPTPRTQAGRAQGDRAAEEIRSWWKDSQIRDFWVRRGEEACLELGISL